MNSQKPMRTSILITALLAFFTGSAPAQTTQTNYETVLKNLKFRSIGPATMGGRLDDIAVVESDTRVIYIGSAAGGLFKTVNGGITWQALFENQPNPSIGAIAIAPSNPSIVYVGTGEANNRQSSSWGNGVYKTMDAGATWTHLGLPETHQIGRIVVNPTDPNIVYIAALGDLWGPNKERGVYMSTDGGAHWTQSLAINEDTGVSDIAIDRQSPNILYATAYQRRRTVFGYNGGGPGSGLYRTTDSGAHWTKLVGGPNSTLGKGLPATGDLGRCAIDIYRKNTNIVYALIEHATLGGTYRSEDKGVTWTHMSDTNPRPSYFSQIRVDPNNELKIWLGGVNIYMSEDGGKSFDQSRFREVHSDVHGIWIDPGNSDHLVIGCDGGIWVTYDSGRAWRHINNIALGQFYEVAYDFQKPYRVCGGAQDNYSWCGPSSTGQTHGIGNEDWITVEGGDGFYNRIDPSDPTIVYAESQDGNLSRRDLKTSESKSIRPLEESDAEPRYRFQWNSPLAISPHDPKTIYFGGNYLFKSTDRGDNWVRLGKDLTTGQDRTKLVVMGKTIAPGATLSYDDGVNTWPCITAIAESPVRAGTLWAGTDDGNLQMSRDDGKNWTNVVSHVMGIQKGAYVSRIEPSRKDEGTVYVSFDNHRAADYGIYIYKTTNFGDSFTRISNGIPPEAGTVHVIREDPANPNLLFAGTEFGLFFTLDKGANWHALKNGLPTVPVFDLQIHPRDHDLMLATHGRSFMIMDDITALEEMDDKTLTSDLKLFSGRAGIEWKMADYRSFIGSELFLAPNAPSGVLLDYYSKAAGPVRITITDKSGQQVRQLTARAEAGVVNRATWDMRIDPPIPPVVGGGAAAGGAGGGGRGGRGGGRGGRGGGGGGGAAGNAVAATPPADQAAGGGAAGLAGELNSEFGAEAAGAGGGGAGGGGGGGGGGRGGRGGGAPLVDPGEYTVTIAMGDKKDSRTMVVEEDPRVVFSAEDRAKRRQAVDTLVAMTKQTAEPSRRANAMTTALTSLTASWALPNAPQIPDSVKKAVDDLNARVKVAAAVFVAAGGRGGRGGGGAGAAPAFVPPPVTQKIQRLMGQIDGYTEAPTARQLADLQAAQAELQKGIAEIDKLWDELPKLNKMMADAGMQYFKVNLDVPMPAAPGRGGGN
ncbi:MAG: hypothetical protein ABSG03_25045 [Bryobacteraceae bacterium]|jgi:hypothetical protein